MADEEKVDEAEAPKVEETKQEETEAVEAQAEESPAPEQPSFEVKIGEKELKTTPEQRESMKRWRLNKRKEAGEATPDELAWLEAHPKKGKGGRKASDDVKVEGPTKLPPVDVKTPPGTVTVAGMPFTMDIVSKMWTPLIKEGLRDLSRAGETYGVPEAACMAFMDGPYLDSAKRMDKIVAAWIAANIGGPTADFVILAGGGGVVLYKHNKMTKKAKAAKKKEVESKQEEKPKEEVQDTGSL